MIDLSEVGAFPSATPAGFQIRFGVYLPGIRHVTDLYVSPTDAGYAKLAYDTYRYSLAIPRFQRDAAS